MNTFDGCCGSCVHMNTNDYTRTKNNCYCTYRKQYYDLNESKCYAYKYDPKKDYRDLNRRWYIVSTIFEKLGLSEDYECVSLLEYFRENVLEKDPKYTDTLAEYDIVGPRIAELLSKDNDATELSKKLIQVFLVRVLDYIKENENDKALSLYLEMVNFLKSIYEVDLVDTKKIK